MRRDATVAVQAAGPSPAYAVSRLSASQYFSRVRAMTMPGRRGPGGVLSQSSVSR